MFRRWDFVIYQVILCDFFRVSESGGCKCWPIQKVAVCILCIVDEDFEEKQVVSEEMCKPSMSKG